MGLKSFVLKKLAKTPGYQEVIHGKFKNPKQEGEGLFVCLFVCLFAGKNHFSYFFIILCERNLIVFCN